MLTDQFRASATVIAILVAIAGCAGRGALATDPTAKRDLQLASAGHTGCLPSENEISDVNVLHEGTGTWNATCKGRIYLCSAVSSGNQVLEYSCAPVAH